MIKVLNLITAAALATCVIACEPDHRYRAIVRQYLRDKGNSPQQELAWSEPDSIFSHVRAKTAHDYLVGQAYNHIDEIYYELLQVDYRSPEYRIMNDSISTLRNRIFEYDQNYQELLLKGQPNRLGITLDYIDADGIQRSYTFIMTNDLTRVDHVLSFGTQVTIRPKTQVFDTN